MNKIIPITLGAVIAIAMVFALAPMDYASTTHVSTPSTATVTTTSIADDTIGPEDIVGSTAANGLIRFIDAVGASSVAATDETLNSGAYDPPVTSKGLITCTVEYSDTAGDASGVGAPTLTLAKTAGTGGVIRGQAVVTFSDIADTEEEVLSATWAVTTVDDSHNWSCTMGPGANIEDNDLVDIQLAVLYFPE